MKDTSPIEASGEKVKTSWDKRMAMRFRTTGIDPELEEELEQMFRGIVTTSDKAWAPFSADNMSHATSRLTPTMDPFGIQHAIKILDELSEEVPKASKLYFFALNLMVNKEKWTVFFSIDPEIRIWWLKREMKENSKLSSLLHA
ncbi:hypothetical protein V6N11_056032 [Hibiscus sabdariffa]|uniref:Uncharacterized protein n=1 Tax=Hibiscus sabdariffa TaxID=183260 RepID=A0ABR2T2Y2_9ROSI